MNRKHIFFYKFLRPFVIVFLWIKFGYRFKKAKNLPENYIVLSNHTTDFDPLFVAASFPRQMYFVGSEHIARWKRAYKFLQYAFAPIMRYKGTVATSTVMDVLRKVRKGANVCIFAEGVRSWDGVTNPILPSTGKLIQSSGCALVTYKLVGGYFTSPNWSASSNTRRGYMRGAPVSVYTKEQIASMSIEEINEAICKDLYEDAYARQISSPKKYRGKRLAESIESLLFICPKCGKIDCFRSQKNTTTCKYCGLSFEYDQFGMLSGNIPFRTVKDFSDWQKQKVEKDAQKGVAYSSSEATLLTVAKHQEEVVANGEVVLNSEVLRCGNTEILVRDISDMAIHGRYALVFSAGKTYYELKLSNESNALKFLLLFDQYKKLISLKG